MVLVGAREERLAQNEALFREVNERVVEVATHFIEVETKGEAVEYTCECGRRDCVERIAMTVAEYQATLSDGGPDYTTLLGALQGPR
jgi:predicted NBD/HSP70 family sugar kinase